MALGEILRNARVQKGLTPSDVAESTRMMVQIVESLEREDFRRIAAPIYGRGFIKLYADLLELDAEPLIRDFMELYDGTRAPAVRTKKVEPQSEPALADEPVPVTRTVTGPAPLSPQRQAVQPRPAVRPLPVPEAEVPQAAKPAVTEAAQPDVPEPSPVQVKALDLPKGEEAAGAFVVEPEEPYAESDDQPDLFHPKPQPPRRQPEESPSAPSKRAEGAPAKISRGSQKGPIFQIGGRMNAAREAAAYDEASQAQRHARIEAFVAGFSRLREGIGRRLPGILSRGVPGILSQKRNLALGGAGLLLLVFVVVGVRVLFKVTGTNVKDSPSVVIERVAPPPDLYVD